MRQYFVVSKRITARERDFLMDGIDFVNFRTIRVGASNAKQEWLAIENDPKGNGYEFEGDPSKSDFKVWVTMPKERLRDSSKDIAHMLELTSKQVKMDGSTGALDNLLAGLAAKGDALSFADCFIVGQKRAPPAPRLAAASVSSEDLS